MQMFGRCNLFALLLFKLVSEHARWPCSETISKTLQKHYTAELLRSTVPLKGPGAHPTIAVAMVRFLFFPIGNPIIAVAMVRFLFFPIGNQ